MNRINGTPSRAPAMVSSQENVLPYGHGLLNKKSLASSTGPQVKSLKLGDLNGSSSLKSNKLAEKLIFCTPSAPRRKLGNVSNQTPVSNQGSFKKPLALSRKEDSFVKPLNFAAAPEHQMHSPTKAVPSLPTVYEDMMENMHPLSWKELREEADPMLIGPFGLENLSEMPFESDEDDESENKENCSYLVQMDQPVLFKAPSNRRKKSSNNFSRLMTLDEICDLI